MKRYDPTTRPKPKPRPTERPNAKAPLRAPTDWNGVADWYDMLVGDEGSEYHREVVLPGVLRVLRIGPGERVLDVACGQGVLCRLLHEKKAQVVGVDSATKLIELARRRSEPGITYLRGDARQLKETPGLAAGSFDAATSVLAIQNIDPIGPVFEGVSWSLRAGGRFLIVMSHPVFRSPKATSWGWEGMEVQYRRVDRYLLPRREPIVAHPGRKDNQYTWTFHRPIQTYVRELAKVGLLVNAIEEWPSQWPSHKRSQPGPRARAENAARSEIPMFMAIRAIKS
jgi:ubiquinone/menaquinone biosynthesis C-methylase UbiE